MSCLPPVKGIPYDFDGSLSLESRYIILAQYVCEILNNNTQLEKEFLDLKTFIENYFSNLDLQDEINNKLDNMFNDGDFNEIITNLLGTFTTPEMYGAEGDGETDDSEAFKKALQNGRNIYLSSGKTYCILGVSIYNDYTNIIGNNATLKAYNPQIETTILHVRAEHVTISNLNFFGSETIGNTEAGCSLLDVRSNYCKLNNINFFNNKYVSCRIFDSENCDFNNINSYGTEVTIETLGKFAKNLKFNNIASYNEGLNGFINTEGECVALYADKNSYVEINTINYEKNPNAVLIGKIDGTSQNSNINIKNVFGNSYNTRTLVAVYNTDYIYISCFGRCSTGINIHNVNYAFCEYSGDSGHSPLNIENCNSIYCEIAQYYKSRTINEIDSNDIKIKNKGIFLNYNCPNSTIIDEDTFSSGLAKDIYGFSAQNINCEISRNALPIMYNNITEIRTKASTFQVYTPSAENEMYILSTAIFKRPTILILKPTENIELTGDYPFSRRNLKQNNVYIFLILPDNTYIEIFTNDN